MTYLNWSIGSLLLVTFFMVLLRSSTQDFAFATPRCLSICRRDEESLCKMCLFREPMRFGKRSSAMQEPLDKRADFRSPMRFGKRWESIREPMRFGKRQDGERTPGPQQATGNYPKVASKCTSLLENESELAAIAPDEVRPTAAE